MSYADRSHLVKKVIEDKNGNHRIVYVNPDKGDHGDEETRMRPRTDARAALKHAIENKGKLSPEHLDALPSHLKKLTNQEKRQFLRELGLHTSDGAKHLAARLLNYAQGREQPKRPSGPDSLYKQVVYHGGIDPKSLSFLAHYSGVKEAMQYGISLGVFRKGGGGLDALAQELHGSGYIQNPDPEHLLDQLRKGSKASFNAADADYSKAEKQYYESLQYAEGQAKQDKKVKADLDAAKARIAKRKAGHVEEELFPFGANAPAEKPKYPDGVSTDAEGYAVPAPGSNRSAVNWLNGASKDDVEAVKLYTGQHYAEINEALRTGEKLDGRYKTTHDSLQQIFQRTMPHEPLTVYRGLALSPKNVEAVVAQLRASMDGGSPIVHQGYVSTSTQEAPAKEFTKGVFMQILAKRGIDVAPVSVNKNEAEILLNHNSKFRVLSMENKDGTWHVKMEEL